MKRKCMNRQEHVALAVRVGLLCMIKYFIENTSDIAWYFGCHTACWEERLISTEFVFISKSNKTKSSSNSERTSDDCHLEVNIGHQYIRKDYQNLCHTLVASKLSLLVFLSKSGPWLPARRDVFCKWSATTKRNEQREKWVSRETHPSPFY